MATPPSRTSPASAQPWRLLDGVRCTGIEAHDLPYAHEKLEPFGLSMVPRLWGWVSDLYLDFCAGEGEYTLRPADVLDYLRGQKVVEEA